MQELFLFQIQYNTIQYRSGINCVDCLPLKRQRCENTRGRLQQGVPENTRAETASQAQRALTGDTEETRPDGTPLGDTRQGGAAGCGTGDTVARSGEAKPTENGGSGKQSLPPYEPACSLDCAHLWGCCDGPTMCAKVTDCYSEVIHWKRNVLP